ncbi:MAG: hypothetical protein KBD21_01945 [Candidatus Pacebacteria bacterium]|nr:hypothetical protein [Candidatus Paceibacterota bacterium]
MSTQFVQRSCQTRTVNTVRSGTLLAVFSWVCLLFVFAPVSPVFGATIRASDTYTLDAGTEIEGDLYAAGERVEVKGAVNGDANALATNVVIAGDIAADVTVAGGTVEIGGTVAGDVRAIGGVVTVHGVIEEDLFVAGGTVRVEKDARIMGGVFVYADHVIFDGVVQGSLEVRANAFSMKGVADHDVVVRVSDSVSMVDDARIGGSFTYQAPREMFFSETATITGAVHPSIVERTVSVYDTRIYVGIVQVLVLALSALLVLYLFPPLKRHVSVDVVHGSGTRILVGFVFLFALPIIAICMLFTIVFAPLGVLLLLAYVGAVLLAIILAPVSAASILSTWLAEKSKEKVMLWVFLGATAFILLPFVPIVGSLVRYLLVLFAFGSLLTYFYEGWTHARDVRRREEDTSVPESVAVFAKEGDEEVKKVA